VSVSNRVPNIIRGYRDHMEFAAFMTFSFIIFLYVSSGSSLCRVYGLCFVFFY